MQRSDRPNRFVNIVRYFLHKNDFDHGFRQELMHLRISFKRGEHTKKRTRDSLVSNNVIDIDATHRIRNYRLNIFV